MIIEDITAYITDEYLHTLVAYYSKIRFSSI